MTFRTGFVALLGLLVPALIGACVSDVKTESAATFSLSSGQTWDWSPERVKPWQQYEQDAARARLDAHEAEAEARREDSGRGESNAESGQSVPSAFAAGEARSLEREHKHIQKSIETEMASREVQRIEGEVPTYYLAYDLLVGGEDGDEDTLLIELVDPATGQALWSGSGSGDTRWGADTGTEEPARMRGVKEAVRHIMKDLK